MNPSHISSPALRRRALVVAASVAVTAVVALSPAGGVSAAPKRATVSADIYTPQGAVQGDRFHAWEDSDPKSDPMTVAAPATSPTAFRPIVAVIDTGIDLANPLFANRLVLGQDLIDNDGVPGEVRLGVDTSGNGIADQAYGHGTHVAGIIAQMAPNAWIMPYRILDSDGVGDAAAAASAVDAAVAAGASIINLSFGTDDSTQVAPLDAAIARAVAANVTVIAAAGNRPNSKLRYPAALPGVVAVAASDGTAALAPFSAYGNKWVDFSAPGIAVLSAVPGGQGRWSGSSMAAGVASGLAASKLTSARTFKWSMLSNSIGGTLPDQLQTGWLNGSLLPSVHYKGMNALQPGPVTTVPSTAAPTTVAPVTTVRPTTVPPTTVPPTTVPRPTTTAVPVTTAVPSTTAAPTTTQAVTTTTAAKVALNSGCANTILFLLAWLRLC
jgi:hypothetical protein